MLGRLVLLSAPSGAGKTTLVRELLKREPELRFSISYTTRPPRPNEQSGRDYFFVSVDEFAAMIKAGEFLEHAQVFDHQYGTARHQVQKLLDEGFTVLLEIDWQGARQVRTAMPEADSVFILPPSVEELERRLRGRGSDSEAVIKRRFRDAVDDISHWQEFDYAVVNDDLGRAAEQLHRVIRGDASASGTEQPELARQVWHILHG